MKNKRIIIFTDAWYPQTNGVVTTLNQVSLHTELNGYECIVVHPELFDLNFALPTYKEVRIAVATRKRIIQMLNDFRPDYIHIATEGPIGLAAYLACKKMKYPYTTSYHTKFPEYINKRFSFIKEEWIYKYLKKIHNDAENILVTTSSMKKELKEKGFDEDKMIIWGRGVNTDLFKYRNKIKDNKIVLLYVGRVSIEKNIEEFLNLDINAEKRVVGDGPLLAKLKEKYTNNNIKFVGKKIGDELVQEYQNADVFVFPSKTDTFGIVQLEAMACGTPVAAYNVTGPRDIITVGVNGYYCDNLYTSVYECLLIDTKKCSESVKDLSWSSIADTFIQNLIDINNNYRQIGD